MPWRCRQAAALCLLRVRFAADPKTVDETNAGHEGEAAVEKAKSLSRPIRTPMRHELLSVGADATVEIGAEPGTRGTPYFAQRPCQPARCHGTCANDD